MPRKSKAVAEVTPKLEKGLRKERTNTDPVIDGEERALANFFRREEVACTSHSLPALSKIICQFLRDRKRH